MHRFMFQQFGNIQILPNRYVSVFVNLAVVLSHISFGILSYQRLWLQEYGGFIQVLHPQLTVGYFDLKHYCWLLTL